MKILRIEIENLASLSGNHVIDFQLEPLASAGVFAITGPTGAGKSTILDAVCLSLFGKTPRFEKAGEIGVEITDVGDSKIRQGDVRTILSDGTAKGFAAVDFIGVDGLVHRATWSVRRAREKVGGTYKQMNMALFF
jgi:exonuclease SbcC